MAINTLASRPGGTVGDNNYDTADFVASCRGRGCTPHVSRNGTHRHSAIDARTARHPGYRISTIKRKRIEEPFGWMKTVGGLHQTRHCRRDSQSTISFASRKFRPQYDKSVWSVEHEAQPQVLPLGRLQFGYTCSR